MPKFAKPVEIPAQYNAPAKFFHWVIAILIIGMLISGLFMDDMANTPLKFTVIQLHKSFGITILLLAFARLTWRYTNPVPRLPQHMPGWQKGLAHATHTMLYVMMFAMPLTGFLMSDAGGYHPNWFGIPVPVLMNVNQELGKTLFFLHSNGALLVWALLAAHVAGALYHHVIVKDNTLRRMLPNHGRKGMLGLIIAAPLLLASNANATTWVADPATSTLNWKATFNGQPVLGKFEKWTSAINFDETKLDTSNLTITVDLTSVNSQDQNRDTTLKGPDFFNVPANPKSIFASTRIFKTGETAGAVNYSAAGNFTLAGVTKPLAVPFTLTVNGNKAVATGKFSISRNAFGVGKGEWAGTSQIGDMVEVTFTVNATAAQ